VLMLRGALVAAWLGRAFMHSPRLPSPTLIHPLTPLFLPPSLPPSSL
jgi:hypothetical protein